MSGLLVILGGMLGAPLRYLIDLKVQNLHSGVFPWGTTTVNVLGGLLVGLLLGSNTSSESSFFLATGLAGALTTYSTFSYETLRLAETGRWRLAIANVGANIGLAILATWLGYLITA